MWHETIQAWAEGVEEDTSSFIHFFFFFLLFFPLWQREKVLSYMEHTLFIWNIHYSYGTYIIHMELTHTYKSCHIWNVLIVISKEDTSSFNHFFFFFFLFFPLWQKKKRRNKCRPEGVDGHAHQRVFFQKRKKNKKKKKENEKKCRPKGVDEHAEWAETRKDACLYY